MEANNFNLDPEENSQPSGSANPQTVYLWKAPMRAYKKRGKKILRFYLALALLLSLIVFFFSDRILLIPIWSLLFLFYTLTITPPPEVTNKITRFGIETAGITLRWDILSHFYFTKRFNYDILTVVTHAPYYIHSYMVIPTEEIKGRVIPLLSEHLIYQENPDRTFTDRAVDWLSRLIPDDEAETAPPKTLIKTTEPNEESVEQTPLPPSLLRQLSGPNG